MGNTELNLREQVEAVILRSGKKLYVKEKQDEEKVDEKNKERKKDGDPSLPMEQYKPIIPYPTKLKKDRRDK